MTTPEHTFNKMIDFLQKLTNKHPELSIMENKFGKTSYEMFILALTVNNDIRNIVETRSDEQALIMASMFICKILCEHNLDYSNYDKADIDKLSYYMMYFGDIAINGKDL
jgi:hypothetical protein